MCSMLWDKEKVLILEDEYAYADLNLLAEKLGTTIKGIRRKAERLSLKRATNNQILNDYKYCSLCKIEHHISHFYKNKAKSYGYEYHCKKYYENKQLRDTSVPNITPLPHNNLRGNVTECTGGNATERGNHTSKRPRNPIVVKNDIKGKVCNKCKTWKPLDNYWTDKKCIGNKKATCIECYKNK